MHSLLIFRQHETVFAGDYRHLAAHQRRSDGQPVNSFNGTNEAYPIDHQSADLAASLSNASALVGVTPRWLREHIAVVAASRDH